MQNNRAINIYLVRHGEANASWDEDRDPGLSAKGKKQATAVAEELFSLEESDDDIKNAGKVPLKEVEKAANYI